jgi:hypothetical protein
VPFSDAGPGKPFLYRDLGKAQSGEAVFSPDVRWIAYESGESGRREIYVQAFRGASVQNRPAGRWQISNGGGMLPRWRHDGKELFFISRRIRSLSAGSDEVMAVEIKSTQTEIEPGAPKPLFTVHLSNVLSSGFTATADGQRFLITVAAAPTESTPATVIVNWPASLPQ